MGSDDNHATSSHASRPAVVGRRRFMALGGVAVASVVVGSAAAVVSGCGTANTTGMMSLFGSRTAAVRAVGVKALDDGPLAGGSPDEVAAMLPTEGINVSVDGTRLVVDMVDPVAFAAASSEQSAAELAAGSLQPVAGYLLTPTEMAMAAAVALSTS